MAIKWPSFNGYAKPGRYIPEWRVGNLVFQSGNPRLKASSMTGGGQIYGHEYTGDFVPLMQAYTTPIISTVGGGQIPARPSFLTALFGGAQGNGN
jgi:hypothetical protein